MLKKGDVFNHNLILIPCNDVGNNRPLVSSLCLPRGSACHGTVLDSAAGKFIKPTHQRSITKMWRALVVAGGKPNPCERSFYVNSDDDVLQQETSYDCGVFVCMFSRAIALAHPIILNANIMDVRRSNIRDLHFQILSPMPSTGVQVGMYYAIDYVNTFYFGRVVSVDGSFVEHRNEY